MSDMDSDLDGDQLQWRDTYFVWFPSKKRPKLKQVEAALKALPDKFVLKYPEQDDDGSFESITLMAPSDHVALESSYLARDDLREEAQTLAEEIKENDAGATDRLAKLAACDARFDIVQFEQVEEDTAGDEPPDEMFDPSTLLIVLGALAKLVDGIGVDPQSGLLV